MIPSLVTKRSSVAAFTIVALWLLGQASIACADSLAIYGLDTLIMRSSEIVEGEVVNTDRGSDWARIEIKVSVAYKGKFKPGQTISIDDTGLFGRPTPDADPFRSMPFDAGDKLVLFLSTEPTASSLKGPQDKAVYTIVASGLRLMQGGEVFDYYQPMNPGGYVPRPIKQFAEKGERNYESFRKHLGSRVDKVTQFEIDFEKKSEPSDSPWLIQFLRERAENLGSERPVDRDDPTELVCARLANWHDPAVLMQALPFTKKLGNGRWALARGFGTPAGREFLMKNIADEQLSFPERIEFTQLLYWAGMNYRLQTTGAVASGKSATPTAAPGNANLITRLATLAKQNDRHPEFCKALIDHLGSIGELTKDPTDVEIQRDANAAFLVLRELYQATSSERIKYGIEGAVIANPSLYRSLESPCADIPSIVTAAKFGKNYQTGKIELACEFSSRRTLWHGPETDLSLVLIHHESHRVFRLPAAISIGSAGSNTLPLPQDLPPGKYTVFLRLYDQGGEIISSGHYCEAEL